MLRARECDLFLDKDLERCLGDLEDLFSKDNDLVYDLDGDLEYDFSLKECFLGIGEFLFDVLGDLDLVSDL